MSSVQPATVDITGPAPTRKLTWVDFARVYALRGWPVFPVHIAVRGACSCGKPACTSKGKHPQTAHSFYDATTDEDVIRTWGEVDYPRANIGIRTGKESGLVVLDIDSDKSGEESLRQLEEQYGALPNTVTVVSGGGGRHLYFQHPGGRVPTTTGNLGPGLDTRGDGGYIVAPPSWHVSGKTYRWAPDKNPEQVELALFPAWLSNLLQSPQGQGEGSPTERLSLAAQVIPEGQQNDELFKLGMALWHKGVAEETVFKTLMSENDTRCVPSLSEAEVKRLRVVLPGTHGREAQRQRQKALLHRDLSGLCRVFRSSRHEN
jgi:putative DNA primase/helicase